MSAPGPPRVFVTGAPRAGTTFVGRALSLPLTVDYLHEPFNLALLPGFGDRFRYVRADPDTPAMRAYADGAARVLRADYRVRVPPSPGRAGLRGRLAEAVGGRAGAHLWLARLNPVRRGLVVKDPTAPFVADHLRARHGVRPVTVVKHPVSLAASLRRVGWHPSPDWFAAQPALAADFPDDVGAALALDWSDPVVAAGAHWRLVYGVQLAQAARARAAGGRWDVVVLEELSADPVPALGALARGLGLAWSPRTARRVEAMTTDGAGEARAGRVQDLRRSSAEIFALRRSQVAPRDRRRLLEITAPVALGLYSEASFGA